MDDLVSDGGEGGDIQGFATDIFRQAAGGDDFSRTGLAQLREAGGQAVAQLLPAHGEAGFDGAEKDILIQDVPIPLLADLQLNDGRDYSGELKDLIVESVIHDLETEIPESLFPWSPEFPKELFRK